MMKTPQLSMLPQVLQRQTEMIVTTDSRLLKPIGCGGIYKVLCARARTKKIKGNWIMNKEFLASTFNERRHQFNFIIRSQCIPATIPSLLQVALIQFSLISWSVRWGNNHFISMSLFSRNKGILQHLGRRYVFVREIVSCSCQKCECASGFTCFYIREFHGSIALLRVASFLLLRLYSQQYRLDWLT